MVNLSEKKKKENNMKNYNYTNENTNNVKSSMQNKKLNFWKNRLTFKFVNTLNT